MVPPNPAAANSRRAFRLRVAGDLSVAPALHRRSPAAVAELGLGHTTCSCMAIPNRIKIKRVPDHYTKTIGRYADGQFMAMITATLPMPIPKDWEHQKRWYSVLHTFTKEGRHKKTEAWFAGTTSEGEEAV